MSGDNQELLVLAHVRPEDIRRGWLVAGVIVLAATLGLIFLGLGRGGLVSHMHVAGRVDIHSHFS